MTTEYKEESAFNEKTWLAPRPLTNFQAQSLEVLEATLEKRIGSLAKGLVADVVTLHLYDINNDKFGLPVGYGVGDMVTFKHPRMRPRPDRIAGKIVKEQQPIVINDVLGHPTMDGPFSRREGILSAAGFPIIYEGASCGVLFISFRRKHSFSQADLEAISQTCRHAASAIHQAGALAILSETTSQILPEEQRTLSAIVNLACSYMDKPAAVWLIDRDGQQARIQASTGLTYSYVTNARVTLGDGSIISQVIETNEPQTITDVCQDKRYPYMAEASKGGWVSMIGYPIQFQGEVKGVIEVLTFDPHIFSRNEQVTLHYLANLASVTIENALNLRELRELSTVAREMRSTPNLSRAMEVIVNHSRKLTGADSCTIFLWKEKTDTFLIGSRSPAHTSAPQSFPRSKGGLTRYVIKTGDSVLIRDTTDDDRMRSEVVAAGTLSLIGVRVQMGHERIGVLYAKGNRKNQFSPRDVNLLQTLADQASVALGWARRLLKPSSKIEKAVADILSVEDILENVCQHIQQELSLDFVAIQLIRPDEKVIETIHGTGVSKKWIGQAKHYLEKNPKLRDIQADIAITRHTEVISGWDERFDRWIYEENQHDQFVRIFTPIIIYRDQQGNIINSWLDLANWVVNSNQVDKNGRQMIVDLELSPSNNNGQKDGQELLVEVIGTIEGGYKDPNKRIDIDTVRKMNKLVAQCSFDINNALLPRVLEAIVNQARQIVQADSASLHFQYEPHQQRYVYEVCAGRITTGFLKTHRPRRQGLGRMAIKENEPKFIPDPTQGHDDHVLKELNPKIYKVGIRTIAAFPLIANQHEGVLYIHFHQPHWLTEDEIEWVRLFANRAIDAIRHATVYTQTRDRARQLATLNSIAQSQVSTPEEENLLRHIGWNTLNILGADVVTIYEYVEAEKKFITPPEISGRILAEKRMMTQIGKYDAPFSVVEGGENVYAIYSARNQVLNSPERKREPSRNVTFVDREKIKSSAGILLKVGAEIVGLMFINYRRFHRFSTDEKRFIDTLASSAAIAIKNRRVLEAYATIDHEIKTTLELNKLLDLIVVRGLQLTRADLGEIRLLDPISHELFVHSRHQSSEPDILPLKNILLGEGVVGWVAANREPALIPNLSLDPRHTMHNITKTRSVLCVPLLDREDCVLGVLLMESLRDATFNRRDQHILERLANQAVIALQNAEHQKHLIAAETIATLGDLAGSLIHLMNNEMGAIRIFAKDIMDITDVDTEGWLMAREIETVVEKLLKDAQSLKNWVLKTPEPVDINQAVMDALRRVRIPLTINQRIELPESMPFVKGGEEQLMHVFVNLIQNAVQAMGDGGTLTIGGKTVDLNGRCWCAIWVHDTGVGIHKGDIENIFQRSFGKKKDGLGFGLWWTRTYIERLNGNLEVQSEPSNWTKFTVTLPAC